MTQRFEFIPVIFHFPDGTQKRSERARYYPDNDLFRTGYGTFEKDGDRYTHCAFLAYRHATGKDFWLEKL